ncbi:MAG: TatD family hydrolase [Pirellulaceae bacterium]|nr:TatD family hydrolase [Pirellulaceae bacterium]
MVIIDTHAHLTNPQLMRDIDGYLQQAHQAQVQGILCVGTTLEDSRRCVDLARNYQQLRAAVGIHPNNCHQAESGDWRMIVELCGDPRVVALGETGLDRYWDDCPWEVQLDYFGRHIELSRQTGLPLVIHTRDCGDEALQILREAAQHGSFTGVMHSFSGSWEVAKGCLELGLYISFAGMITFKNAGPLGQVARQIPDDRILVETDSPYLTPHPYRGQRPNHPALVTHTLLSLAELRGVSPALLAEQTTGNAHRLFNRWSK